jgi:arylsulfatase A-like enzyme
MVGEVMRTLDELKLRDNTLVILTSDNGGMLNQGGQEAWTAGHRLNGDLLGFKFDSWEGGHRVPFIARRLAARLAEIQKAMPLKSPPAAAIRPPTL